MTRVVSHLSPVFQFLKIDTIVIENFMTIYLNLFIFELAFQYSILFRASLFLKLSTDNTWPSSNEEYNAPTGIKVCNGEYLTNLDNKLKI